MSSNWIATLGALAALSLNVATAAPVPPDEVVKTTTANLQKVITERQAEFKKDPAKLYDLMETSVVPKFDVKYITQLILARHWRKASEEQRARFEGAFKQMLVRTYATALVDNADTIKAEFLPLRMAADATETTVDSKLLRPDKPPVPIGFAMRLKNGEWKIYDIIIENLSLIQNFRSQISAEIKRSNLEAVITKLESEGKGIESDSQKKADSDKNSADKKAAAAGKEG